MKENKVHKRVIFYVVLYASLAVISIGFITTSFVIKNTELQKLTATLLILWLPLIFATVLTHLPQTIAGNLFMYMKIADTERRREKFLIYTSGDFCKSDEFDELVTSPDYTKIKTVKTRREKKEKGDKTHYFTVLLRNGFSYKVAVVKRDKRREGRYTTTYVVDSIELDNANINKKNKSAKIDTTSLTEENVSVLQPIIQNIPPPDIAESQNAGNEIGQAPTQNVETESGTMTENADELQKNNADDMPNQPQEVTKPKAVNVPRKTYPQTKKRNTSKKK